MFSLIITIVSIALVAALAVATIFYGGDAMSRGQAAARAAAVVNGGEQIMAAVALYRSDRGQVPPTLETLRTEGYLSGFPDLAHSAGFELVSSAYAAPADGFGDWLYDHQAPHLAFVGELSMEACAEVNRLVSDRRIVLNRIDPDPHAQCVVKGAQTPVAVFRHPGEGFASWTDHPRIPEPVAAGTIKRPDLGADICVYGCDDAGGAPTEPTEPEEPGATGAQFEFSGPTISLADMYGEGHSTTQLPYYNGNYSFVGNHDGTEGCSPILTTYAEDQREYYDEDLDEYFQLPSLRVNGEALTWTYYEDMQSMLKDAFAGLQVSASITKAAVGAYEAEHGEDPQPLYLGVFSNGNWVTYPNGSPVSATHPNTFEGEENGFTPVTSVNGVPQEDQGVPVLEGAVGLCAVGTSGGGFPSLSAYRIDLSFSRNGDSDSQSLYYYTGGW